MTFWTFVRNTEKGTLLHCLWECPKIQEFWKDVTKCLSEVFKVKIPLKAKLCTDKAD